MGIMIAVSRAAGPGIALLALAGCTASNAYVQGQAPGYLPNPEQVVSEADWNRAERVDVAMEEFAFVPSDLVFKANQPYRLHFENKGAVPHTFASEDFFKSIAVDKVVGPEGTVSTPRIQEIGLSPGQTEDVYFIGVRPGTYSFECTKPLHSTFGMTGKVTIL